MARETHPLTYTDDVESRSKGTTSATPAVQGESAPEASEPEKGRSKWLTRAAIPAAVVAGSVALYLMHEGGYVLAWLEWTLYSLMVTSMFLASIFRKRFPVGMNYMVGFSAVALAYAWGLSSKVRMPGFELTVRVVLTVLAAFVVSILSEGRIEIGGGEEENE